MDRLLQWTLILIFAFGINLIAHAEPKNICARLTVVNHKLEYNISSVEQLVNRNCEAEALFALGEPRSN